MRNAFLALVLANLAFAAWQRWLDAPDQAPYIAPDVPTIELASERTAASDRGATEVASEQGGDEDAAVDTLAGALPPLPDQTPAASAPSRCVSVGPFRELAQAASAAANLRAGGHEPSQRAGEGDIWVGYWVYIDSIPSREAANEIVENLRQNGITDSYVIPESDSGSLVSLGVFSEIARAGGRREEARRLGYEPVISDRTRRGTVYWVDVMLEDEQALDLDLLQSPGRILRLEQRSCERDAA